MAASRLKSVLQYTIMILLTAGLLWLSLRGLNVGGENKAQFLWATWNKASRGWLLTMAAALLVSHVIRAERWRMLLVPSGNKVSLWNSLLSLLIGYLVNLAIPRGGEVSRCYNLYKLENTAVEVSFGTVVVERIVDVICLFLVIVISFVVEWDKLAVFINSLNLGSGSGFKVPTWAIIALVGLVGLVVAGYALRNNQRLKKIMVGFKEGLLSVFLLKNKALFLVYSVAIWVLYGFMSYCIIKAFPETEFLGIRAVLTLFAIGAIAMAAPLPGGAGSYHTLVPLGLVMLYNMAQSDAIAFTFIFHAWQTLIMIITGVVSFIISYWLIRWKAAKTK